MKRVIISIGVIIFFFLCTALFTYPAIFHLQDRIMGDGVDSYQYIGFQKLAYENITSGKWPFTYTNSWRFPSGFDFSRGFDGISSILLGASLTFLTRDHIVSYNITIFLLFMFNSILSFFLFKEVGKSVVLGILGAIIYGFSFYVLARSTGHINLMGIGGFPFLIYSLVMLYKSGAKKYIILTFLSFLLIILSSVQYLAICFIFLALVFFMFTIFRRNIFRKMLQQIHRNLGSFFIVGSLVFIVIAEFLNPYLSSILTGRFLFHQGPFHPAFIDYLIPNSFINLWIGQFMGKLSAPKEIESAVFIGFIELVLFSLYLLFGKWNLTKKILVPLTLIFLVFSFGLTAKIGLNFLPFSAIPEAGRYYVIFYLLITISIVLFLKQVLERKRKLLAGFILIIILSVVFLERIPKSYLLASTLHDAFIPYVQSSRGEAVFDIPLLDQRDDGYYLYYGKKIISGYIHWSSDDANSRAFINGLNLDRFICNEKLESDGMSEADINFLKSKNDSLIDFFQANKIHTIVVHKDHELYTDECLNVLTEYNYLIPHIEIINKDSTETIYHKRWSGGPLNYVFYFPYNGDFQIKSLHFVDYNKDEEISIKINGEDYDYLEGMVSTNIEDKESKWIVPTKELKLGVQGGTQIGFYGKSFINSREGFVTIRYSFARDVDSKVNEALAAPPGQKIHKLYEDDLKEVWEIN